MFEVYLINPEYFLVALGVQWRKRTNLLGCFDSIYRFDNFSLSNSMDLSEDNDFNSKSIARAMTICCFYVEFVRLIAMKKNSKRI